MKRILSFLLALSLVLSFAGCAIISDVTLPTTTAPVTTAPEPTVTEPTVPPTTTLPETTAPLLDPD